jgi:hypothetical protein
MKPKTVWTAAVGVALLLTAYSLGLHHHVLNASTNEIHVACHHLCLLGRDAGEVHPLEPGGDCDIEANGPVVSACVQRAGREDVTVTQYRCVKDAQRLENAQACGSWTIR